MHKRPLIQIVAATVVLVFAIGIWSTGDAVKLAWLRFFSLAVLVATAILAVWDHWLWHWPIVQRIPNVPRDVRGTWKGTLASLWIDPSTAQRPAPKDVFLTIRQTASHTTAVLLTDESTSRSSLAGLSDDGTELTLTYMYLNRPAPLVEQRSRMHNGAVFLTVSGRPPRRISGRYWTDRDTRGELDFVERQSHVAGDFREAAALFILARG
jgi:hypothetical protein